jgi:hypothetical protein
MNASSNKRPVENFIIGKQGVTTMVATGNLNDTDGDVRLADGQLGIVSDSIYGTVALNAFCDATPTVAEAPVIAIYQGTSDSAAMATATATYPLWVRPYERTAPIDGRGRLTITKQIARVPSHSIWIVGDATGNDGEINVLDETEYTITTMFRGRRIEEFYSEQSAASLIVSVTTPNFTDLGKTETEGRSYLVHNLAYQVNQNSKVLNLNTRRPSKSPVVAFAIDTTGASGTAIGENAGGSPSTALAAGDVVPVVNTTAGLRNITLTEAQAESIKNAALELAGGVIADLEWTIVTIDLASAYTDTVDLIMLMALDENTVYVDYIPQVKVRLEVGLTRGFDYNTVLNAQYSYADEGQGDGRSLNLLYNATQGQRKYNLRHEEFPVVNFDTAPFDTAITYCVYNILHSSARQVDTFNTVLQPFREIVAVPTYSSGTTPNNVITLLDNAFAAYIGSTTHNHAVIALN